MKITSFEATMRGLVDKKQGNFVNVDQLISHLYRAEREKLTLLDCIEALEEWRENLLND